MRSHSKTSSSREITLFADIPQVTDGLSRHKNTFPNFFRFVFFLCFFFPWILNNTACTDSIWKLVCTSCHPMRHITQVSFLIIQYSFPFFLIVGYKRTRVFTHCNLKELLVDVREQTLSSMCRQKNNSARLYLKKKNEPQQIQENQVLLCTFSLQCLCLIFNDFL